MTRISNRPKGASDATPQIASAMALDVHDWREARHIDTSQPLGDSVAEAQELCCLAI
jgi:predicted kinase